MVLELPDDELGAIPMHCVVPRLSKTPGAIRRPAPKLGEHNSEILGALGLTPAELARLAREEVIYEGSQRRKAAAAEA